MSIKDRIQKYFREKSPFRITTDLLFYLLILALLLPFSRKHVATGLNKLIMHRPSVIQESGSGRECRSVQHIQRRSGFPEHLGYMVSSLQGRNAEYPAAL